MSETPEGFPNFESTKTTNKPHNPNQDEICKVLKMEKRDALKDDLDLIIKNFENFGDWEIQPIQEGLTIILGKSIADKCGVFGENTKEAVREFQDRHDFLESNGELSVGTLEMLIYDLSYPLTKGSFAQGRRFLNEQGENLMEGYENSPNSLTNKAKKDLLKYLFAKVKAEGNKGSYMVDHYIMAYGIIAELESAAKLESAAANKYREEVKAGISFYAKSPSRSEDVIGNLQEIRLSYNEIAKSILKVANSIEAPYDDLIIGAIISTLEQLHTSGKDTISDDIYFAIVSKLLELKGIVKEIEN